MCELRIYQDSEYDYTKLSFEKPSDAAIFIEAASIHCKRKTRFELIVNVCEESEDD